MTLNVELDGRSYTVQLGRNEDLYDYRLAGIEDASGLACVVEAGPGIYSVLLGTRSFAVHVAPADDKIEIWAGGSRSFVSITDTRDRPSKSNHAAHAGPLQLRAQMPGKIVKVLVEPGAAVHAGQGLIVVEAMKMQNEVKSPKHGTVTRIHTAEGATVEAGVTLVVVE